MLFFEGSQAACFEIQVMECFQGINQHLTILVADLFDPVLFIQHNITNRRIIYQLPDSFQTIFLVQVRYLPLRIQRIQY